MLNRTGIRTETYTNVNQILFATQHHVSVGVVVDDANFVEEGGRKIVKAGTPLTGNLDARTTPFTVTATNNVKGVLLHDVDVTAGDANGTLLLFGFVNTNRLDTTTKSKITDTIKNALPMIKFIAC